jgi:hypothetical protein
MTMKKLLWLALGAALAVSLSALAVVSGLPNPAIFPGTVSSIKPCDSGYTRIAPNHCERTTTNNNASAVSTTCTQITLPTGAKALHFYVVVNIFSNNAVGDRLVYWQAGKDTNCGSLGNAIQIVGAQVREFVATPGTVIYNAHADVIVPVSTSTGQLWQASVLATAGVSSQAFSEIRGYFD